MAQLTMETGLPNFAFSLRGDVEFLEQYGDPGIPGVSPSFRILHDDQGFQVRFDWQASGWLANFLYGHWHLGVHFEQQGPGEGPAPLVQVEPNAIIGTLPQSYTFSVPSGFFGPIPDLGTPGARLYRVTATITLYDGLSTHGGGSLAGFCDLGLVQILSAR